jgi:hypothetical protein
MFSILKILNTAQELKLFIEDDDINSEVDEEEELNSRSSLTQYSKITNSVKSIDDEKEISLWEVAKFLFSFTSPKKFVMISLMFSILSGIAFTMYAYPEVLMIIGYTKFDNDLIKERESY